MNFYNLSYNSNALDHGIYGEMAMIASDANDILQMWDNVHIMVRLALFFRQRFH